jgi:C-terminal processing protease CtpA/Prc
MLRLLLPLCSALLLAAPAQARQETSDRFTPDQVRADFDALYDGLQEAHYDLFAETPKALLDQRHAEMRAGFDRSMSRVEMEIEFQRFIALARHGHARIDAPYGEFSAHLGAGGRIFPVELRVRGGALYAAESGGGLQAGDEILAVGDLSAALFMTRLTRNLSAETPRLAHTLVERIGQVLFWIEFGAPEQVAITVRRDGERRRLEVNLLTLEALRANTAAPAFSLEGRDARMLAPGLAYLRPGPFYNTAEGESVWDNTGFVAYMDQAFESFLDQDADTLLLDLRDNPGGNSSFSDPMLAWFADRPFAFTSDFRVRVSPQTTASNQARLDDSPVDPGSISTRYAALFATAEDGDVVQFEIEQTAPRDGRRFSGEVYVLVNRYSYSNAVTTAAIVQDYGFGTVIGEGTADMATALGAMERFALPHSGVSVGYPKALIIRPNGETRLHALTPDVELAAPFLRGPEDEMLAAAIAWIEAR